jgi:glycosyltransferase involved in cell wall biosynthesis
MVFVRNQVRKLRERGVGVRSFFLRSRTNVRVLIQEYLRLWGEVRMFNPNILHAQYGSITGFLSAMMPRIPFVVTFRGSDLNPCPNRTLLGGTLARAMSRTAAWRASSIICVSEELRRRVRSSGKRIHVIPSGVDLNVFIPIPQREARSALGWPESRPAVLFNAGRDPKTKQLQLARASVEAATRDCGDVRFEILDGTVEWRRIPLYLNAADCLLVTSIYEGSPNIVKEALACNLPIVSVDVGDVRWRLQGISPSAVVERDPELIGQALAGILRTRQRSNGRDVVGEIDLDNTTTRIVRVYQEILEEVVGS